MSDRTEDLKENDFFYIKKMSGVCQKLDDKGVTTRMHNHRGKLFVIKNALCIVDKVAWYAR